MSRRDWTSRLLGVVVLAKQTGIGPAPSVAVTLWWWRTKTSCRIVHRVDRIHIWCGEVSALTVLGKGIGVSGLGPFA
jgi:hypothetical protein